MQVFDRAGYLSPVFVLVQVLDRAGYLSPVVVLTSGWHLVQVLDWAGYLSPVVILTSGWHFVQVLDRAGYLSPVVIRCPDMNHPFLFLAVLYHNLQRETERRIKTCSRCSTMKK